MDENEVERSAKLVHFKAAWINLDSNIHTVRSLAQQPNNKKLKNQSHNLC